MVYILTTKTVSVDSEKEFTLEEVRLPYSYMAACAHEACTSRRTDINFNALIPPGTNGLLLF